MVEFWGDVGFLLFTFSTWIFTLIYMTLSKAWRKSFIGAVIAIFAVGVSILCAYLSLRIWDVTLPGVEWVRLILFWILGLTMMSSIIGFLEVQFGKRGERFRRRLSARYDDVRKSKSTD
jgi:hypothetical protein